MVLSKVVGNAVVVSESGAGASPVNPYSVGGAAGIAPQVVDAPISFGSLTGSGGTTARPPA